VVALAMPLGFEDASAHQLILSVHHSPPQNKLTQNGHFFMRPDLLDRRTIVAKIPYPCVWVFTVQAELAHYHASQAKTSAVRMLLEPQAILLFNAFDGAR
jgi:hypothetical protein